MVILPQQRWAGQRSVWQRAEQLGFAHAWTYDHLAWRSLADEPWFATVPLLAAAAAVTERIGLGTWVASPNFRHPVPFAKDVMGLDDISGGRFRLGVGAGGQGFDAHVLGQATGAAARTRRFAEFVALLDELLTHPVTDHRGEFYAAVGARMRPGPIARPRPPFIVAANGPKAMAVAARFGQGWATTGPAIAADDDHPGAAQERWWAGVADLVARFEDTCARHPDRPAPDRYLNLDAAPVFSLSSMATFTEGRQRAAELGFTDLVVHWPRESGLYAAPPERIDEVAAALT